MEFMEIILHTAAGIAFRVSEETAFAAILMYVTSCLCVFQREFRYGILDKRTKLFFP